MVNGSDRLYAAALVDNGARRPASGPHTTWSRTLGRGRDVLVFYYGTETDVHRNRPPRTIYMHQTLLCF